MDHGVEADHLTLVEHVGRPERISWISTRAHPHDIPDPVEDRRPTHVQDLRDPVGGESVSYIRIAANAPRWSPGDLLGHASSIHNATPKSRN